MADDNAGATGFRGACPMPISDYPEVLLAHGGGGRLMHDLIGKLFRAGFAGPRAGAEHDGAVIELGASRVAFTTDSFVVRPLFFPGGDIGTLAVCGTVNDLAMCGARPEVLSTGFIIEEGLEMETLWRVVRSMGDAARRAGVEIVTGDTKVVDRGKGDGVFINTAGIGIVPEGLRIGPARVRPGDRVLVNGDLGRHGVAVMAARDELGFSTEIESDCAPLAALVRRLIDDGVDVHCLRDLTRGGLGSALNEIAVAAGVGIEVDDARVPVCDAVRGACELLGLDPVYVANEGRLVAFVPEADVERALAAMGADEQGRGACVIGEVRESASGLVTVRGSLGAPRVLPLLSGEQLPRIC